MLFYDFLFPEKCFCCIRNSSKVKVNSNQNTQFGHQEHVYSIPNQGDHQDHDVHHPQHIYHNGKSLFKPAQHDSLFEVGINYHFPIKSI